MSLRSAPLFAVSLLLLAASAGLGLVLIHDGEVGIDAAKLAYTDAGDAVRLKGDLATADAAAIPGWADLKALLHHSTYVMAVEGVNATILVTGMTAELDGEDVVVEGPIVWNDVAAGIHVVIVDADAVTVPFFAW